jgi:tetratricopeptide (TPR) repeat protein
VEPLGTITKYYPFIDEESKSILDSLMEESTSYYDFVNRLCDVVIENEVPVNLSYLAAVQSWWCRLEDKKGLIQEKYKDVPCIRPWGYAHNSYQRDQILYHDEVVEGIDKTLQSSIEDWMETELHLLHAFYHWPGGVIPDLLEPVEKAKTLIDSNPLINCFSPLVYAFEAMVKAREACPEESIDLVERGRELAETYDDAPFIYMNILEHATFLRKTGVQESIALFEELYELAQDLEVPYFQGETLHDSALVFETAGEYDLALSSHFEKMKVYGLEDTPDIFPARIYATMGDGENALASINAYFEYYDPVETPIFYLWKAWALALVDDLEEAERTLEIAHSMMIKSGAERVLGNYYHFTGVVELRRGNLLEALDLFEKAWDIAQRNPAGTNQNRALLDLARAENLFSSQSKDSSKIGAPGKWLCKLETYAEAKELPGIRMQAALLKSEFYQNHDQLRDAQAVLRDALNITDSPGVTTLRKIINARIAELERHMIDEELVS